MINRLLIGGKFAQQSTNSFFKRGIHKGSNSTPPMRFITVKQKIALYSFISMTFLSYPTYVLANLDSLRPRPENALSPEVLEELEQRKAARKF